MSSDEEDVRRPGREGHESPTHSNANGSGAEQMDEDEDLFGSDGEGGLDDIEYANHTTATRLDTDRLLGHTAP
jgi:RNA polymerase-associated protein LEO1